MNKKEILNACILLLKYRNGFLKDKEKFVKRYPESYLHFDVTKRLNAGIYIDKYNEETFYQPSCIKLSENSSDVIIECEKIGLFSWSSGSCNKITLKQFSNFIEIDNTKAIEVLNKLQNRYSKGIEGLRNEILKKISNGVKNE